MCFTRISLSGFLACRPLKHSNAVTVFPDRKKGRAKK
jgi:hypothetical protein